MATNADRWQWCQVRISVVSRRARERRPTTPYGRSSDICRTSASDDVTVGDVIDCDVSTRHPGRFLWLIWSAQLNDHAYLLLSDVHPAVRESLGAMLKRQTNKQKPPLTTKQLRDKNKKAIISKIQQQRLGWENDQTWANGNTNEQKNANERTNKRTNQPTQPNDRRPTNQSINQPSNKQA